MGQTKFLSLEISMERSIFLQYLKVLLCDRDGLHDLTVIGFCDSPAFLFFQSFQESLLWPEQGLEPDV